MRRRGRARAKDGEGARDGLEPELRPQSGRAKLPARPAGDRPLPGGAAAQPRLVGALHAWVDLQGRHRGGRARHREVHARLHLLRPRLLHRVRPAREQLRHVDTLRDRQLHTGARQLDQLVVLRDGEAAGARDDPGLRAALRLLPGSAHRPAVGRARAERALSGREAAPEVEGEGRRPRAARLRAGADAGHSFADGDGGRGDREQGRRDGALPDRSRAEAGRLIAGEDEAARAAARRQASDCRRDRVDDGGRRHRWNRNRGSDPRRPRRRARRERRRRGTPAATRRGSSPSPRSTIRGSRLPSCCRTRAGRGAAQRPRSRRRSCRHFSGRRRRDPVSPWRSRTP